MREKMMNLDYLWNVQLWMANQQLTYEAAVKRNICPMLGSLVVISGDSPLFQTQTKLSKSSCIYDNEMVGLMPPYYILHRLQGKWKR